MRWVIIFFILAASVGAQLLSDPEMLSDEEFNQFMDEDPQAAYELDPERAVGADIDILDDPDRAKDYFKKYPEDLVNLDLRDKAAKYLYESDDPDPDVALAFVTTSEFDSEREKEIAHRFFEDPAEINNNPEIFENLFAADDIYLDIEGDVTIDSYGSDGSIVMGDQKINLKDMKEAVYGFKIDKDGIHIIQKVNFKTSSFDEFGKETLLYNPGDLIEYDFTGEITHDIGKTFTMSGTINGYPVKGWDLELTVFGVDGFFSEIGGLTFSEETAAGLEFRSGDGLAEDGFPALRIYKSATVTEFAKGYSMKIEANKPIQLPFESFDSRPLSLEGELWTHDDLLYPAGCTINSVQMKTDGVPLFMENTPFDRKPGPGIYLKKDGVELDPGRSWIDISFIGGNELFDTFEREYVKDGDDLVKYDDLPDKSGYEKGINGYAYRMIPDQYAKLDMRLSNEAKLTIQKRDKLTPLLKFDDVEGLSFMSGANAMEFTADGLISEIHSPNPFKRNKPVAFELENEGKTYRFDRRGIPPQVVVNGKAVVSYDLHNLPHVELSNNAEENRNFVLSFDDLMAKNPDSSFHLQGAGPILPMSYYVMDRMEEEYGISSYAERITLARTLDYTKVGPFYALAGIEIYISEKEILPWTSDPARDRTLLQSFKHERGHNLDSINTVKEFEKSGSSSDLVEKYYTGTIEERKEAYEEIRNSYDYPADSMFGRVESYVHDLARDVLADEAASIDIQEYLAKFQNADYDERSNMYKQEGWLPRFSQYMNSNYGLDMYVFYSRYEGLIEATTVGIYEKEPAIVNFYINDHPDPDVNMFYSRMANLLLSTGGLSPEEYKAYTGSDKTAEEIAIQDSCRDYTLTCCDRYPSSANCP